MKRKALAIVLTLLMLVSVLPMGAFAASYTDTEGHWAEKSIDRWTQAKNPAGQAVLEGMGDNTYAPDNNLTRAQAMTIFSRLLNLVETADISKITDVASDAWYAQWIEKGYAYKIINGTSDTTFDPEGSITREQFFSIFARAMGIPGADKLAEGKTFTDLDDISSWFVEEGTVYAMINAGYLNGYPDGSLQPKGNITRAEVAQVLANAIESNGYITADGTYDLTGMKNIVVVLAKNVTLSGTYTGHIVSSCVDSTLYTTKVNPSSVKVAVNTAADNVKVGNSAVANPPYTPANPYNASGANYVYVLQDKTVINPVGGPNGGGGGGGGGPARYVVNATFSVPYVGNNSFTISSNIYTAPQKVGNVLRDMSKNAVGDMGIINAVNSAYGKLADEGKQVRHTADGYVVTSEAKGDIVEVTVEGDVNLVEAMNAVEAAYTANIAQAVATAGVPENVATAWVDLAEVFTPNNMFNVTGENTLEFLSGEGYAKLLSDAFAAAAAVADTGMTQAQLDAILAAAGANWNPVAKDVVVDNFFNGCNFTSSVNAFSDLMSASVDFKDDANFIAAVQDVFGMTIDRPELKAIVEAGFHHDGWMHGVYSMEMGSEIVK